MEREKGEGEKMIEYMGAPQLYFVIFTKGNNFREFALASLEGRKALSKGSQLLQKWICSYRDREWQNENRTASFPEKGHIHIKSISSLTLFRHTK